MAAETGMSEISAMRQLVVLGTPGDRDVLRDLLRECMRRKLTALIIHSDPHAISVAQFFAEHGVVIPDDLAIVSYDDEVAQLADPPLTAVRPPKSHVGRLAVELMVSRLLNGERRPTHQALLAPELVVRGSSPPRAPGLR
jgi:DNA-binding LacI/PurR family transcriptional regulator